MRLSAKREFAALIASRPERERKRVLALVERGLAQLPAYAMPDFITDANGDWLGYRRDSITEEQHRNNDVRDLLWAVAGYLREIEAKAAV